MNSEHAHLRRKKFPFWSSIAPLLLIFSVCFVLPSSAYIFGFAYDRELDKKYRKKAVLIIDATIEVVKKEYLDRDSFSIQNNEAIRKDVFMADQDIFTGKVVHTVRYLVQFKDATVVSGKKEDLTGLQWSYANNAVSMCPFYPRDLIQKARYRFYINSVNDQRAYEVKLLQVPADIEK